MCWLCPLQASHTVSLSWASLALLWRWHCTSAPLQRPRHATCSRVAGISHYAAHISGGLHGGVAPGAAAYSRLMAAGCLAKRHWQCDGGGSTPLCRWQSRRHRTCSRAVDAALQTHYAARQLCSAAARCTAAKWPVAAWPATVSVPAVQFLMPAKGTRHHQQP